MVVFLTLYIGVCEIKKFMFLLALPGLLLEIFSTIKLLKANKSGVESQVLIPKRFYYQAGVRLSSALFLFVWLIIAELASSSNLPFYPAFIPVLLFAIYSLAMEIFCVGRDSVGQLVCLVHKAVRAVGFGQLVYLSTWLTRLPNDRLEISDLQDRLWTIQVGGLILIPVLAIVLVMYAYFVVNGLVSKSAAFNHNHLFGFLWTATASGSLFGVFVLVFKMRAAAFDAGEHQWHTVGAIAIVVGNLLMSTLGRHKLV